MYRRWLAAFLSLSVTGAVAYMFVAAFDADDAALHAAKQVSEGATAPLASEPVHNCVPSTETAQLQPLNKEPAAANSSPVPATATARSSADVWLNTIARAKLAQQAAKGTAQASGPEPAAEEPDDVALAEDEGTVLEDTVDTRVWMRVTSARVNVRAGPTSSAEKQGTFDRDTRLVQLARKKSWVRVIQVETGKNGWVYGKYLAKTKAPKLQQLAAVSQ